MNENEIRRLIRIVEESGIDELEVSRWGRTVRIVKRPANGAYASVLAEVAPAAVPAAIPHPPPADTVSPAAAPRPGTQIVRAPMVGTLYRAPSPEAPAYVEVGDRVRKGQTLCILEAMKLMNEIESEWDGTVRAILADNGEPIEYGQPLFEVELA